MIPAYIHVMMNKKTSLVKKIAASTLIVLALWSGTPVLAQTAADYAAIYTDLNVFETPLATRLKKGVKRKQLNQIRNEQLKATAFALFEDRYDEDYRIQSYEAYLSPTTLGQHLMIGDGYSQFENITGIYLPLGTHVVLVDHIPEGMHISLVVPNWERRAPEGINPTEDPAGWGVHRQQFSLRNGVNIVELKTYGGLAYVHYYADDIEGLDAVQVHFPHAAVNGYFDIEKHTDEDWDQLLEHAVYPVVDARGRHSQLVYPVEALKKYAHGKGEQLLNTYDSLVYRQHRLLGLEKYSQIPKNRILARVNYNYYMFRDGDGVAYMGAEPGYAMQMVTDPDRVTVGDPCWGFSHEVGHVHQVRPQFNWGGLGEVSNNLFSLYVTKSFGNKSRIMEQNNYASARTDIIDRRISYLQDEDVFNRLVPFWQLHLYFTGVGENPDFYPDLFERFREQNMAQQNASQNRRGRGWGDRGSNPAEHQLHFVKTVCEVSQTDLTAFFDQYGFFYVGEFEFQDYGSYTYKMTQEMVDTCREEIAAMGFKKPEVDISTLKD